MGELLTEKCHECGKEVPDDEWVDNWGSCHECFNRHLDKYFEREGLMAQFEFLDTAFLEAMNDIGRYGNDKYGADSFHQRAKHGDRSRGVLDRAKSEVIIKHSQDHGDAYLAGERHDKFGTLKHQLAAAAFNAMMEFYFAGLENENAQNTD